MKKIGKFVLGCMCLLILSGCSITFPEDTGIVCQVCQYDNNRYMVYLRCNGQAAPAVSDLGGGHYRFAFITDSCYRVGDTVKFGLI